MDWQRRLPPRKPWPTAVDQLSDVDATAPADGDTFIFDAAAGLWKPGPPATPIDSASDVSYSNATSGLSATQVQAALDELAAKSVTGAWTAVKKTANEARSSTTTYANDAALQFAVASGNTYAVRGRVFFTSAGQALKHQLASSGATSNVFSHLRQTNSPGSAFGTTNEFTGAQAGFWFATTSAASGAGFVEFDALFTVTAAGTFAWQWAQNVSAATTITVLKGSYLEYALI